MFSTKDHTERLGYFDASSHMEEMKRCRLINSFKCFEWNELTAGVSDIRYALQCGNKTCVLHEGW